MSTKDWIVVRRYVRNWTYSPEDKGTPRDCRGQVIARRLSEPEAKRHATQLNDDPNLTEHNHWAMEAQDF